MNAMLMLDIADKIEARPELYDQRTGVPGHHGAEKTCPLCLAGNTLRLLGQTIAGREWTGNNGVAATAERLLDLTPEKGYELFSSTPEATGLVIAFSGISTADLDGIEELKRWTLSGGLLWLCPRQSGPDNALESAVTFNAFWQRTHVGGTDKAWRRSAARVMAATLRLIARGPQD